MKSAFVPDEGIDSFEVRQFVVSRDMVDVQGACGVPVLSESVPVCHEPLGVERGGPDVTDGLCPQFCGRCHGGESLPACGRGVE
jgi:hypothetical protein